jgi:TRAP-type C4-dicarboxylate transport system permease small subunit
MKESEEESVEIKVNCGRRIYRLVKRLEEIFFAFILLLIVILGLAPIVLRTFFQTGFSWGEPLSRQMVLWIALFGAGAATQERKHISIDVISHFLSYRWKAVFRALTGILAAFVCGILTCVSVKFVLAERQYASPSSVFSSVPEWIFETVLPIGFLLLTVRLLIIAGQDLFVALRSTRKPE